MNTFPRFPSIDLPAVELPFDLPAVELPSLDQLTTYARDAAYIGVGLAVLTAERLVAMQAQLTDLLREQLAGAVATVRAAV